MFRIEFFPADQGDAIWIEYGKPEAIHRVLIDAGTPPTADLVRKRIEQLAPKDRRFDLFVITHVDTDHIGGVLKLLANLPTNIAFDDVWFNGWSQIRNTRSSKLGPIDGEILSNALTKLGWPWNKKFKGAAVMVPPSGALRPKKLRGGMTMTVLSPGQSQLASLRKEWAQVVKDAGLDPANKGRWQKLLAAAARKGVKSSILGEPSIDTLARSKFETDAAPANGSTIALLAEFGGKRVLLSGDAYAPVLVDLLGRVSKARGAKALQVDVFKLPHHGSRNNVSNELLAVCPASAYVFSTSGAIFGHPDDEAFARVIARTTSYKKVLYFNYTTATIAANCEKKKKRKPLKWNDSMMTKSYHYSACFPPTDATGITIDL